MEYSSFFNSEAGDRKYKAEDWDRHLKDLIGNGAFKGGTNLQVTADGSGMTVALQSGSAWINGKHYLNDQALTFAIETADGVLNRIDRIILCLDYGARTITAQVKKGTFASNAAAPDLQRNADKYELCVANISVPAGTSEITQSLIADTRLDNSVCGIVTGLISQVDTSTFYNQIQNDLAHFKSDSESGFSTWSDGQKAAFNTWLNEIKSALDGDTAGNLLNLINEHKSDTVAHMTQAQKDTLNTAVQSATLGGTAVPKSGTTLQLPAYPSNLPANGGNSSTVGGYSFEDSNADPSSSLSAGRVHFTWS